MIYEVGDILQAYTDLVVVKTNLYLKDKKYKITKIKEPYYYVTSENEYGYVATKNELNINFRNLKKDRNKKLKTILK